MATDPPKYEDTKTPATIIHLDGRTGGGKSSVANALYKACQGSGDPFLESDAAVSCTQNPQFVSINEFSIIDNPGLGDTEGVNKDSINLQKSITLVQKLEYLNVEIVVLEASNIRFDAPLQDMILLKVNSFGTKILTHIGFVINKCPLGVITPYAARKRINDFATILCSKLGIDTIEFPFWMFDCHPELLTNMGVREEIIASNVTHLNTELKSILEWAKAKPAYPTADVKMAEYKLVSEARIAKEKALYMKKYAESYGVISRGSHTWSKTTPAKHKITGRKDCVFTCPCGASHVGDDPPNSLCDLTTKRGATIPSWEEGGRLTEEELAKII
jgi:hypothetical protein